MENSTEGNQDSGLIQYDVNNMFSYYILKQFMWYIII